MDISKKQNKTESSDLVNKLTEKQLIRWYALCEAIDVIDSGAVIYNMDFDKINIKPNRIQEYIDITEDIITRKIRNGEYDRKK